MQPDPDVAYFRSRECSLTAEQKSLLQNLAFVCSFKATSDLPQWLTSDECDTLRAFFERKSKIKQISRYVFQIDDRTVDFSPAMPLLQKPKGFEALEAAVIGWLGNRGWALRINDKMGKDALEKMRQDR